MLSASDPLAHAPHRILVTGVTGVGKSTLCRRLALLLNLPYTELDSLHHGPEWSVRADFEQDVARIVAQPRWVSELGYSAVRDVLALSADTVIWLDYPRRVALPRLIARTLRRRLRREELWNGNVEPPLHTFFTKPEVNILRWEMSTRQNYAHSVPALADTAPHLAIVRVRSQRELERWLAGPLAAASAGSGA